MRYKSIFIIILIATALNIPKTIQAAPNERALIKGLSEKVYVIEHGLKRWIKTADIFNALGYSWANIASVPENTLNDIPPGKDITNSYQYPDGTLVKGDGPPVYLIEKDEARWIPNPQIFTANGFKWQNIITIPARILGTIRKGQDVSSISTANQVQTWILSGPCAQNQTSIPQITTGQIEFGYSGSDGQGNSANLSFETFLNGYDNDWQSSWSSYKRKIDLPAGTKTYTFYVRAKTLPRPDRRGEDGVYDTTPAFCKFTTNLSPYYQQVEISYIRDWGTDPANEEIVLSAGRLSESINITGWTIKAKKRVPITIPQAVKSVYSNSIYNHKIDLILEAGETVNIHGGTSPVRYESSNGASPIGIDAYKPNKCEEYWNNKPEYDKCRYENYQYPDFFKKEWQIYLNRTSEFLAEDNEEVILRDRDGLTVDIYSY